MDPATASDSISQLIAGGGIAISGVLVLKLVELGTKMWTARNQKGDATVGPQPFEVKASAEWADRRDCKGHLDANQREHENLFGRVALLEQRTEKTAADIAIIKNNLGKVDSNIDRLIWRLIPESRTEAK